MSKFLSREAILNVSDIKTEEVPVPEWGGVVLVKGLTGEQRNDYEMSLIQGKGKNRDVNMKNAVAKLVGLSIVDEDGKRIFTDADVEALGKKSGAALSRVQAVASKLSGLSDGDMDELTKN